MKIIKNTRGNILESKPDYSRGRLLQGDDINTLIYTTWEEQPPVDETGEEIQLEDAKTQQRVKALEENQEALQKDINITQLALTDMYETMVLSE